MKNNKKISDRERFSYNNKSVKGLKVVHTNKKKKEKD